MEPVPSQFEFQQMSLMGRKGISPVEENQDRVLLRPIELGGHTVWLLAVADGVSRCPCGGAVAEHLIDSLARADFSHATTGRIALEVRAFLKALNLRFYEEFNDLHDMVESACTFSGAILDGEYAHCMWAGDSPIYRARQGKTRRREPGAVAEKHWAIRQISKPDLHGTLLADCFGAYAPFKIKYRKLRLAVGDSLVVATDGVAPDGDTLAAWMDQCGTGSALLEQITANSESAEYYDDASLVMATRRS